jgi:uncharacterized protein (TIGR02466 family)
MFKGVTPIFSTPLYTFEFERHQELKEEAYNYLRNEDCYTETREPYIMMTSGNIHKLPQFRSHYYFFNECLNFVMADLGYSQNQSITTMWGTKQKQNGFHHPHKHGNSFLAGVYYFHGNDQTNGTTFLNTDNLMMISPNRNMKKAPRISPIHRNPFVEGTFIVFPANVLHTVDPNSSGADRYVLGVNSMPVGKSDQEPYDRFVYGDMAEYN